MENKVANNSTEILLRRFADRQRLENDLSDMLYAAMHSFPDLAKDICRYFEFVIPDGARLQIRREMPIDAGRPDFFVSAESGERMVIEVKLDDKEYHFKPYSESSDCSDAHIVLLTNHVLDEDKAREADTLGWTRRTWSKLLNYIDDKAYGQNADGIRAFVAYARAVTGKERLTQMKFDPDSLASLKTFIEIARTIIDERGVTGCKVGVYGNLSGDHFFGLRYWLEIPSGKRAWPWIGFSFGTTSDVTCSIELDQMPDNSELFAFIRLATCPRPIELRFNTERDCHWFSVLNGDELKAFSDKDLPHQKEHLKRAFVRTTAWLAEQLIAMETKASQNTQ